LTVLPPPTKYSIDLRTVYIAVVQPRPFLKPN